MADGATPGSGRNPGLAAFAMVLVSLIFSGWHILGKVALNDGTNPIVFACFRELSASLLMALMCLTLRQSFVPAKEDVPRILFCGFCSFANVVGFVLGLKLSSAATGSALQPTIPVFASLLAILFGYEALQPTKVLAIALSVGGSVLVVLSTDQSGDDKGTNPTIGNAIFVGQCVAMSCLIVFQRPLIGKYTPTQVTMFYYASGTLLTVAVSLQYVTQPTVWELPGWQPWVALAYAAIFATWFNYTAMTWSNLHLEATVIALFSSLQPIGTTVMSVFLLNGKIVLLQGAGGALIVLGLFLTARPVADCLDSTFWMTCGMDPPSTPRERRLHRVGDYSQSTRLLQPSYSSESEDTTGNGTRTRDGEFQDVSLGSGKQGGGVIIDDDDDHDGQIDHADLDVR